MKSRVAAFSAALFLAMSIPASATYNATVVGTISWIGQMNQSLGNPAETIVFALTNQPTGLCSSGYNMFVISPASVTDAQSRKNLLAMLLSAKATGSQVQVAYDNTGGYCDQGMPAVYYIDVM